MKSVSLGFKTISAHTSIRTLCFLSWAAILLALMPNSLQAFQGFQEDPFKDQTANANPFGSTTPQAAQDGEKKAEDEKNDEEAVPVLPPPAVKKLSEKYVRFHMWDGSIVGGEVQVDSIPVRTEFGTLKVPIRDISKFYPGLNSFPELSSKIELLVDGLGDKDFDVREKSHRELTSMGVQIRNELDKFEDEGSAERKKRIAEIKKELDEQLDSDDEDSPLEQPLIRGDRVDTPQFSIVGKIEQQEFVLDSKFGELRVMLGDVKMADRSFQQVAGATKKKFDVSGHTFLQKKPLSTRMRINKGDKVSISGSGVIQWTNWSTSSSPDGLTNQGQYKGINGGTLICRIGASGAPIKVGSKTKFVAKQSGILYLAIAMQDSYTKNTGYRWTGNYKVKVEVKPAGTK